MMVTKHIMSMPVRSEKGVWLSDPFCCSLSGISPCDNKNYRYYCLKEKNRFISNPSVWTLYLGGIRRHAEHSEFGDQLDVYLLRYRFYSQKRAQIFWQRSIRHHLQFAGKSFCIGIRAFMYRL